MDFKVAYNSDTRDIFKCKNHLFASKFRDFTRLESIVS